MITYRNTRTGRTVERAEPDELMDRSKRWERVDQDVEDPAPAGPIGDFDPAAHGVEDVLAYLEDADDDERSRVLGAERDGKARKSILSRAENA